ncbi:MAG: SDR family oxidoreductase [Acidimicrobiia bacterium]
MSNLPRLAVTGATGEVGGRVARRLSDAGVEQRLVVRRSPDAPSLPGAVAVEASDYGNFEEMARALQGASTLFLVSGRESRHRLEQHMTAVDAAARAGVERIVYLSFLGASPDATFTLARQHHATEQHIREHRMRFTFLRSSMYADFVPYFAGSDGIIQGPAGEGRVSWISRDDIADTVVAVLGDHSYDGETLDNTGPAALDLEETAAVLSRVTGRGIGYVDETVEQAWESRRGSGAPDWEIEGWVSSYVAIAAGQMDIVSGTVERLTGRPARDLESFLAENPGLWSHLVV